MKLTLTLLTALCLLTAFITAQKEKWQKIFNGKDFTGWTIRGEKVLNDYRIENGEIVGVSKPVSQNTFLCTNKDYSDFILELDVKVDTAMNSGIQIRSHSRPDFKNGRVHGYQIEIDPSARAWSGGIYDEARRGWLADLTKNPAGQKAFNKYGWNKYRIEANGPMLSVSVNGVPTASIRDTVDASGFIALQVHGTKVERPMEVRWRNIRLMEIGR